MSWKIRLKAAYVAQLPVAFGVGAVVTAVAVYVLKDYMALGSALAMGALMLAAIPVIALGPALSSLEPYPTAAQHVKKNLMIDLYDEMKRQELSGSRPTHRLPGA